MGLPVTLLTRVARNRRWLSPVARSALTPPRPPSRAAPDLEMGIRRTKSGATTGFLCIVTAACAEDRRDVALLLAWSPTNLRFPTTCYFREAAPRHRPEPARSRARVHAYAPIEYPFPARFYLQRRFSRVHFHARGHFFLRASTLETPTRCQRSPSWARTTYTSSPMSTHIDFRAWTSRST